jgi:prepilin-type N-terminal cleavage/methylation domain-containing protein
MKGASGGFTITEVLIVLAVSGAMLTSAATIFSNRQQTTEFSQAVYDLRSELQSIAGDVSSQSVPGLQQYICSPTLLSSVMRPTLASGSATNQDCIYLGQAIQVAKDRATLYSYPIFGLRTVYNSTTNTGATPTTPAEAHAEPAIDSSGNVIDAIRTTYTMINGLQFVSAQLNGTESDVLTLYSNLQSNNTNGNEIDVKAIPVTGNSADPDSQIKPCIEGDAAVCPAGTTAVNSSNWNVCVTDGTRQAMVSLAGTPTGITTNINMNGCS